MRWLGALLLAPAALAAPVALAAQMPQYTMHAVPDTTKVTIGQPITLRVTLRFDQPQNPLLDRVPRFLDPAVRGVRILSADSVRTIGLGLYEGTVRVAVYRVGAQMIPPLTLPFRRAVTFQNYQAVTEPVSVDVVPMVTSSDAQLEDIRPLVPVPRSPWPWLSGALLVAGIALAARRARRRRAVAPAPASAPMAAPAGPDPYAIAVERLGGLERASWASADEVERHVAAVADALRDYLAAAERMPAREWTTAELLRGLPERLRGNGDEARARELFGDADLVKFAGRRPAPGTALELVRTARMVLDSWHAARNGGGAHAVR